MFLVLLILIPYISSFLCFFSQYINTKLPKFIALITMFIVFLISIKIWLENYFFIVKNKYINSNWDIEFIHPFIKKIGIDWNFGVDGLSILMVLLTILLGIISILCSWKINYKYSGFFYFNFLFLIGSIIGTFISLDLFLFFCFWEITSFPIYFLLLIWGFNNNNKLLRVSNNFFIYSQISSFFLLLGILGIFYNYYFLTNIYTFNYNLLLNTPINFYLELFLMFLFFLSFSIKIPTIPFHNWVIDFHEYSPVSGFLDLSGILIKTSIYGLLRFNIPFFYYSSFLFSSFFCFLGLINIFYFSYIAFIQKDIKRLISYGSISNMGFILIAIYSFNILSSQGLIIQIFSHAFSTAALFILIGKIYFFLNTRKLKCIIGFSSLSIFFYYFFLFFSIANLGIPGTGNFTGEFLILLGSYFNHSIITIFSLIGLIFSMIYSLRMMRYIFFGNFKKKNIFLKIQYLDVFIMFILFFFIILLGIYPKRFFDTSYHSILNIYKNFKFLI
ncbi:complex I subunit 4 family protein [Buchnera aphidicola]|uniref:complex I subunit 4 family protein n=1 Tax=Buchnera aphidicola TaxID=9 RepID=UPI0031B88209